MFSWLNRCWGGMGVTTVFERARLQSTYADWAAPDPQSLNSMTYILSQSSSNRLRETIGKLYPKQLLIVSPRTWNKMTNESMGLSFLKICSYWMRQWKKEFSLPKLATITIASCSIRPVKVKR